MKTTHYHYILLKLLIFFSLYAYSVEAKSHINPSAATNSSKKQGGEEHSTTTIDSKKVVIFRMWHAFNPEMLQKVNGIQGNDLMPLPNTQTYPYQDILLQASAKHPQILIYDGKKLTKKQIQMFEDLHQKAKNNHGTLFSLDFNAIKKHLSYADLLSDIRYTEEVSTDNFNKANYVDLLRLIILYNMDTVLKALKRKYHHTYDFKYMLYADFDRKIEDALEEICTSTCTSYRGIRVPMTVYMLKESDVKTFSAQIENNFILCTEAKTPVILQIMHDLKEKKRSNVFCSFCKALVRSIKEKYKQEPPTVQAKLSFDMQGVKFQLSYVNQPITQKEFMKLYRACLACGVILPKLEVFQDQTWNQDMNSVILAASK